MEEKWLDIEGYDGYYQVSNLGRVRSIKKNGKIKILKPELLEGYHRVTLTKNYIREKVFVHRLVCKEFNGLPNDSQNQVDHINTIRTDNRSSNLRWSNDYENNNNPLTRKHKCEGQTGRVGYWKGKKRSEETKKKMSESHKKKIRNEFIKFIQCG